MRWPVVDTSYEVVIGRSVGSVIKDMLRQIQGYGRLLAPLLLRMYLFKIY